MKKISLLLTLLLNFYSILFATGYYVDFQDGSDSNDGLSEIAAWKHCPGDPLAEGNADAAILNGGDVVYFKSDVTYRGSIRVNASGTTGNPIIFKGDGWGPEKAVIDGSDTFLGTWQQCVSADQCNGNPNYSSIYFIDAPEDFDFFNGFYEDGNFLWFSQDPNPDNFMVYDRIEYYYPIAQETDYSTTYLTLPTYFNQSDADYWNGSYISIWINPNVTPVKPITSYNPSSGTVNFEDLGGGGIYTDRDSYFSVFNNKAIIDTPGEYCFDAEENRIYLWPLNSDSPVHHTYTVQKRSEGFNYSSRSNIIIEGFIIQDFTFGIRATTETTENVTVRNNVVRNLRSNNWYAVQMNGSNITVENNVIEDCIRSVGVLVAGTNQSIKNNTIRRTTRNGIWSMGTTHGVFTGNVIDNINGTHSNAMSVYLYNKDILVASNRITNSERSFTFHGDNAHPENMMNLTLFNNYFENSCHSWGKYAKDIKVVNNLFQEGLFFADTDTITCSINNIFHAGGGADIVKNNIYTDLGWWQQERYGWSFDESEIDWTDKSMDDIFADIENENFGLIENSPALNNGIDPMTYLPVDVFPEYDFYTDIYGNPRPAGSSWDIGPVEGIYIAGNDEAEKEYTYSLSQNYPNPFNPSTSISYSLKSTSNIKIELFNILGQKIMDLINTIEPAGEYTKQFNLVGLSSGVYFYRIIAKNNAGSSDVFMSTRKMILVK